MMERPTHQVVGYSGTGAAILALVFCCEETAVAAYEKLKSGHRYHDGSEPQATVEIVDDYGMRSSVMPINFAIIELRDLANHQKVNDAVKMVLDEVKGPKPGFDVTESQ